MTAPDSARAAVHWHGEPAVIIGVVLLCAVYAWISGPLRRRQGSGVPLLGRQVAFFILSNVALVLAVLSPLNEMGDRYLFSAHVVQHLLLAIVWPLFLLLSLPAWLVSLVLRWPLLGPALRALTVPVVALVLFNLAIYGWHLPLLFRLASMHAQIHAVEHVTYMALGVLNWWPLLSPLHDLRLTLPAQVAYLATDETLLILAGLLILLARAPIYSTYVHSPRIWPISPLAEQRLAGLVLWALGTVPYAAILVKSFVQRTDGVRQPGGWTREVVSQSAPPRRVGVVPGVLGTEELQLLRTVAMSAGMTYRQLEEALGATAPADQDRVFRMVYQLASMQDPLLDIAGGVIRPTAIGIAVARRSAEARH